MSEKNHNFGSKLLHQLALGNTAIGEAAFDLERLFYASKTRDVSKEKHIFVAGLARAGTTILMRRLNETGAFRSLAYRDMPFVLAPNLWRKISKFSRREKVVQERAHGDGILVDFDSPEAFEEVFWRVFCGPEYIKHQKLIPMYADNETLKKLRIFIALVLKDHCGKRYLSKNNNNVLRLGSVAEAFPNAFILIPFREPIQHAYSLMRLHNRFIQEHKADAFFKKYMTWLVHHEFGSDHRPFVFDENVNQELQVNNLNYWLQLWVKTYSYIRENLPQNSFLLSYERLCDDTKTIWTCLSKKLGISPYGRPNLFQRSHRSVDAPRSTSLLKQATDLYKDMMARQDRTL